MEETMMRMAAKTGRKRTRMRYAALSLVAWTTAVALIQSAEPVNCKKTSTTSSPPHNNNHLHRPASSRQRVLSQNNQAQNHHDLLHFFDSVWKDVSATTASTQTVIPKCIMPNGDVIGISVDANTLAQETSGKAGKMNSKSSRRRRHRGLYSSSRNGSRYTLAAVSAKTKKSKKGSRSKISNTNNVNPNDIANDNGGNGTFIFEQSLPLCNVVDDVDEAMCSAHEKCADLDGACCPTADRVFLDCCDVGTIEENNIINNNQTNSTNLNTTTIVDTIGDDDHGNLTLAIIGDNTTPENNNMNNSQTNSTTQITTTITELDRCTQIAENIGDNSDSHTAQLTMTYTVFSDSDLSDTNLHNLQKFFQHVVGPMAAGCTIADSTKEEALLGHADQQKRHRRRRRRFLQQQQQEQQEGEEGESEIRRLSFDTPSIVTAERGGDCGSIPNTDDASSTCTVLAQDVTMNYVGDFPNIRGLLLVAAVDSMDPASVLSLGLTGVSDITVLAQPPTVAAPSPAPILVRAPTTAPSASAPSSPTNLPLLKNVTSGNNNPRPDDSTGADDDEEGGGDNSGPAVSSVNRGNDEEPKKKTMLSPGAIAGIVLACIFALLAMLLLIRRRRRPRNISCRKTDDASGEGLYYTSEDDDEFSAFMNNNSPRALEYGGGLGSGGGGGGGRKLARVMSETSSHSGGSAGRVQHIYSFPVDADGFPRKSPSVIQVTDSQDEIEVSSRQQQQSSREIEEAANKVYSVRMLSPEEIPYRPNPRLMERNYLATDTVQL